MNLITLRDLKIWLLILIGAQAVSFLQYWLSAIVDLNSVLTAVIGLIVLVLAVYKLEYGVYAAVAELISGGQGHLFDLSVGGQVISIRMMIFGVIMIATVVHIIRQKQFGELFNILKNNKAYVALGAICLIGVIIALMNGNRKDFLFNDVNAWLYFAYLIPFLLAKIDLKQIGAIFVSGTTIIAAKTLFYFYIFTHDFRFARDLYTWGRDTRFGEFAYAGHGIFRIFAQAHIFTMVAILALSIYLYYKKIKEPQSKAPLGIWALLIMNWTAILISLSRSIWIGLFVSACFAIVLLSTIWRPQAQSILKTIWKFSWPIGSSAILGLILAIGIVQFPLPNVPDVGAEALLGRFSSTESAVSSRGSQLGPLLNEIKKNPLLGFGWGKDITYKSFDARVIQNVDVNGMYNTYAFEWGYLDILLKIGALGFLIYVLFIAGVLKKLIVSIKQKTESMDSILLLSAFFGIIGLLTVHMFTPYLNHPLGIGIILIAVALNSRLWTLDARR